MIKSLAKRLLTQCGIEVRRLPRSRERVGGLGLARYDTALGSVYVPAEAPNDSIAAHMRRGEVFEPEIIEVASRFITPGTAVIDVGANFGQMTMLFARKVGPEGRVYSLEAQARVFEVLTKNLQANGLMNVQPLFNAALEESGRILRFPDPDFARFATYGSFNLPLDAPCGTEVTSLRVDDIDFKRPVSFMKVDVQGCDLFAMQGARETIARYRMPIIFEFEQRFQGDYGTAFQDYVDFVQEIDYEFVETVLGINFLIKPRTYVAETLR